jgi:hypothetical protein
MAVAPLDSKDSLPMSRLRGCSLRNSRSAATNWGNEAFGWPDGSSNPVKEPGIREKADFPAR